MTVHDDECCWFARNPSRSFRCRLATLAEIDILRDAGWFPDGIRLEPGCFIYAMFHIDRETTTLDGRLAVLEAGPTWDEAACCKAWFACEEEERTVQ
jgi:hypothetical protein